MQDLVPADYLLVVIVAVVLTGSNVIGFTKCSKQASKQIRDMASSAITTGLTVIPSYCLDTSCTELDTQQRLILPSI